MNLRKILKSAGLALILMPEPFTTPLGLALLGASYIFARLGRVDTPESLRGFIKMYLKETRTHGEPGIIQHKLIQTISSTEWRYQPEKNTVKSSIDTDRLLLRFGKDLAIEFAEPQTPIKHDIRHRWAGFVWPGSAPDIRSTPAGSHVIGTSRLSVRYLADVSGGSAKPVEKIVRHEIRHNVLQNTAGEATPEKITAHNLNAIRVSAVYSGSALKPSVADMALFHGIRQDLSGYVLPSVAAEKFVVHSMNCDKISRQYAQTKPSRGVTSTPAPVAHTFNPAKASLALGIG